MEVAAFWIFLAAIIVAAQWKKKHTESMRHETLRLIIEKNPNLDQEQIAEMLTPKHTHPDMPMPKPWAPKPGDARKGFRIFGTIVMFVAFGLTAAGIWLYSVRGMTDDLVGLGISVPIVALFGISLFICSHLVSKPQADRKED